MYLDLSGLEHLTKLQQPLILVAMSELSVLVLSDIHYGSMAEFRELCNVAYSTSFATDDAVIAPMISCIQASDLRPTMVLVPGDLTSTACPQEFFGCYGAVKDIAKGCGLTERSIYHTFGNHDCDWQISQLNAPKGSKLPPDDMYLHLAARSGSLLISQSDAVQPGPLPGTGIVTTPECHLIIANSGLFSNHTTYPKFGELGKEQMQWLTVELSKPVPSEWKLFMVHHHPFNYEYPTFVPDISTLVEGADLLKLLGASDVDLVCHGHRHHPSCKTIRQSGWKKPITFFCAGSVGVHAKHRSSGKIPNLFHVISLSERLASGAAAGHIHSFEFVATTWEPARRTAHVPLSPKHPFGSDETAAALKDLAVKIIDATQPASGSHSFLPAVEDFPSGLRYIDPEKLQEHLDTAAEEIGVELSGDVMGPRRVVATWK